MMRQQCLQTSSNNNTENLSYPNKTQTGCECDENGRLIKENTR
jgi:hypothetical protein